MMSNALDAENIVGWNGIAEVSINYNILIKEHHLISNFHNSCFPYLAKI